MPYDHLFELRPIQKPYIATVRRAHAAKPSLLMLEGGTGAGKGRAAAIPFAELSLAKNQPVLFAVPTLEHRRQVLKELQIVCQTINAHAGTNLRVQLYISRTEVISPIRVKELRETAKLNTIRSAILDELLQELISKDMLTYTEWRQSCGDDIDDITQAMICYSSREYPEIGINDDFPITGFVVTTHAMLIRSPLLRTGLLGGYKDGEEGEEPNEVNFCGCIVDEAHKLVEAAIAFVKRGTTVTMLEDGHAALRDLKIDTIDLDKTLSILRRELVIFLGGKKGIIYGNMTNEADSTRENPVKSAYNEYLDTLKKLRRKNRAKDVKSILIDLIDAMPFRLGDLKNREHRILTDPVCWIEYTIGNDIAMSIEPGRGGGILWWIGFSPESADRHILFTSATLSMKDKPIVADYNWFCRLVGTSPSRLSPFSQRFELTDFGNIELIYPDPTLAPTVMQSTMLMNDSYVNPLAIDYWAEMIRSVRTVPTLRGNVSQNRTLVLCHSYTDLDALSVRLSGLSVINPRLVSNWRQAFENDPFSILLSVAWEGIDLPGLIDNLMITRLPRAPMPAARLAQLEAKFTDRTRAFHVALQENNRWMKLDLAQGIGRLVRNERDCGRIIFGDKRISLPYADRFSSPMVAHFSGTLLDGQQNIVIPVRWRDKPVLIYRNNALVPFKNWRPT